MKVRTSVLIEEAILRKAQQIGLNVSQFCENAIKIGIEALETANQKIAHNQTASAKREVSEPQGSDQWCGRRDLNPGRQRGRLMS